MLFIIIHYYYYYTYSILQSDEREKIGLTEKVPDLRGEGAVVLLGSVLLPLLSSAFPNYTVEGIMHLPPYCTCAEHGAGRSRKDMGTQNQISKSSRQVGDLGWR